MNSITPPADSQSAQAIDRRWSNRNWYTADEAGKVYDPPHKLLAVLMDIRDQWPQRVKWLSAQEQWTKATYKLLERIDARLKRLEEKQADKPVFPPLPSAFFNDVLAIPIEELELSVRSENVLKYAGIKTIGELIQRNRHELLREPNFGKVSLKEVEQVLADYGVQLSG